MKTLLLTAIATTLLSATPAAAQSTAKLSDGRVIQLATERMSLTDTDLAKFAKTADVIRRIPYKIVRKSYRGENATRDIPDARKDGYGDCKSLSVAFRNSMVEQGYPVNAMLLAFGTTEKGIGHMVVIIKTTAGDLTFDSRSKRLTSPTALIASGFKFEGIESAPGEIMIGYSGTGFRR